MFRRRKIGVSDDQSGFEAGAVERSIADGADAARLPGLHQPVPQAERQFRGGEEFIAEIAGKAGARNRYGSVLMAEINQIEDLQVLDAGKIPLSRSMAAEVGP